MAITVDAAQNGGTFVDGGTSVARAFPNNLTAGRMIVMVCAVWDNGGTFGPFVAGNCTKTAGTATIGAVELAVEEIRNTGTTFDISIGIWTALVTGSGSCTMTVGTFPAGSFGWLALMEVSSDVGWDASRLEASSTGVGNSTTPDSGNASSADEAVFVGAFVGNWPTNSTITPDGAFTTCFESEDGTTHQPGSAIYRVVTSDTTDSASWTNAASDHWAAALAVFKEAAATAIPVRSQYLDYDYSRS